MPAGMSELSRSRMQMYAALKASEVAELLVQPTKNYQAGEWGQTIDAYIKNTDKIGEGLAFGCAHHTKCT